MSGFANKSTKAVVPMAGWCFGGCGRGSAGDGGLRTAACIGVVIVERTVIEVVGGSDCLTRLEGKPCWKGQRECGK